MAFLVLYRQAAAGRLEMAAIAMRAAALALIVANPLVLLHLIGGVHLDALLAASRR